MLEPVALIVGFKIASEKDQGTTQPLANQFLSFAHSTSRPLPFPQPLHAALTVTNDCRVPYTYGEGIIHLLTVSALC